MSNLDFFHNQAKNFLKDWKTQKQTIESGGFISYHYDWKFYDVEDLFFYYEFDDKDEQDIKPFPDVDFMSRFEAFIFYFSNSVSFYKYH